LLSAYGYTENILQDLAVDVFTLAGLPETFDRTGGEETVRTRMRGIQLQKSIMRCVTLDAGDGSRPAESYIPQNRSVAGLDLAVGIFKEAFCSGGDIPWSILMGQTVGGLNTGTNSGEHRSWYAKLGSKQTGRLTRWLNWMLTVMMSAKEGPTGGRVPPTWTAKWRPLWAPTDAERAEARFKRIQGDRLLFDMGATTGLEIRETRIVQASEGEIVDVEGSDFDAMAGLEPEDPNTVPPPAEGADVEKVADEAMNGAQVSSMIEIVEKVALGTISRRSGIEIIRAAFPTQAARAELIVGEEGVAKPPPPPVPFGAKPPAVPADPPPEQENDGEDEA